MTAESSPPWAGQDRRCAGLDRPADPDRAAHLHRPADLARPADLEPRLANPDRRAAGLDRRLAGLERRLAGLGSVLVAFSGGADSAFLLAAAARALGPDSVVAATAVSPSLPAAELAT